MFARVVSSFLAVLLVAAVLMADGKPVASSERVSGDNAERIAKGKDLVDSICFWCHEPELMRAKRLSKAEWASLISGMIFEGAPVTNEEFDMITDYLAATYGPAKSSGNEGENK